MDEEAIIDWAKEAKRRTEQNIQLHRELDDYADRLEALEARLAESRKHEEISLKNAINAHLERDAFEKTCSFMAHQCELVNAEREAAQARAGALEAENAKLLELAGELAGAELNYRTALSTPGYHRTADEDLELLRQAGEKMRDWSYQQEQLAALGETK